MILPAAPTALPTPAPAPAPRAGFRSSIAPLSATLRTQLRTEGFYHQGCPVPLSGLRALRVSYHGFDGRTHTGRIVVNAAAAAPLPRAFRRLYALHFPIRRMGLPVAGDVTASFSCRQ